MKQRLSFTMLLGVLLALSGSASAQYLVASKAGFVNRADGVVHVLRHDSEDGKAGRASLGTQLRDGDELSTDANSRAEILLNPGSYLRLDENSVVRAINTDFSQTRFELLKGAVIVEVGQLDKDKKTKAPIELLTPNGALSIAKETTLMRVDAKAGATTVAVRQGEIYLGTREVALADNANAKVKRGKLVRLTTAAEKPEIAKVDQDALDSFDVWSFNRAQTLVAANLTSVRQNSLLSGGWYYNSFYGCYSFVPWRGYMISPYGFGFFNNYADCYGYYPFYRPNYYPNTGSGGVVVAGGLPSRVISGNDRGPMQREIPAGRGLDTGMGGRGMEAGDFGSRGISTASSSSTSAITSAPAATMSTSAPARSSSSGGAMPSRGNN